MKLLPYQPILQLALFLGLCFSPLFTNAFVLQDSEGKLQKLADYKGKWVVVNFWATWCPPCIKEIPDLAAFSRAHAATAVVLGVALDYEADAEVRAFARKIGMTYPLILGEGQSEKQIGKIVALPTTLVYDPGGKLVFTRAGGVTRAQLEELLLKNTVAAR
jgi:thiol-disulfide isomerase/thioredoxin